MSNNLVSKEHLLLSDNARFVFRNGNVVALNKNCGQWFRFTEECYKYLLQAIENKLSEEQFVSCVQNEEDKLYIKKLINNLRQIEVIVTADEKENEKYINLNSVNLMLTDRCNLSCKHCAANAASIKSEEYFDTLEMKKILDKIMQCKPETMVITGGEPLLRNDFVELIKYIKAKSNIKINLMTNATLITPEIALEIAKYTDTIDISLDGYDEASCSYIRGKGVFDVVLRNIKLLKESGCSKISLSMVSLHRNPYEEHKFKELCEKIGVLPGIRRLSLAGRAKENAEYLEKESTVLNNPEFINVVPMYEEIKASTKACACQAGVSSISIEANGDILPCSTFSEEKLVTGNIKDIDDIKEFLNTKEFKYSEGMKKFMESSPYGDKLCRECEVRHFCWTCPYGAIDYIKNRNEFDKYCKGRKEFYLNLVWRDGFE